jgi:hypothetical protein
MVACLAYGSILLSHQSRNSSFEQSQESGVAGPGFELIHWGAWWAKRPKTSVGCRAFTGRAGPSRRKQTTNNGIGASLELAPMLRPTRRISQSQSTCHLLFPTVTDSFIIAWLLIDVQTR